MLEAVLSASCLLLILILKEDPSLPPLANPIMWPCLFSKTDSERDIFLRDFVSCLLQPSSYNMTIHTENRQKLLVSIFLIPFWIQKGH